jgi:hypothetical protein
MMRKIVIIIICLLLLLTTINLGTSKPIQYHGSTFETDYSIDNSIIDCTQEQQILQNLNRLDGFFTENQGQVGDDSVRYYIQGKGVWFLDDGIVFEVQEPIKENEVRQYPYDRFYQEYESKTQPLRKSVVLNLNFVECNEIEPIGVSKLQHRSNFFYGNDSSKWCTNVPNFQEIVYENIYNNIDLRYYSNDKGLKYDFIVHPSGNLNDIKLKIKGANKLFIDTNGDLGIQTSLGNLIDSELLIFQDDNNGQNKIESKFIVINDNTYGFGVIGDYNKNKKVIIDPLIYSTFIGGTNDEYSHGVVIDTLGNAYITGSTLSNDFPISKNANDTTHNGYGDVFVLKLNSNGSSIIYSTFIGGSDVECGISIQIDSKNNSYITGGTHSSNFPVTAGAFNTTYNGMDDVFILKLNSSGSKLNFSTFIGGSNDDHCSEIELDSEENIYIIGETFSTDFPVSSNANDTTHNGFMDIFVLKLNSTGDDIIFSTYIGGSTTDAGRGIVIDNLNNIYITGGTNSIDFPITSGAINSTVNSMDVFVLKLNNSGSTILYSTYIGGNAGDHGTSITLDPLLNIYITGETKSDNFPTTSGAYNTKRNGITDVFVLKLNLTNFILNYSTFVGGNDDDEPKRIVIDTNRSAYVSGYTNSNNFPTTSNSYDSTYNGNRDVFLFKINPNGSSLLYSTYIGGTSFEYGGVTDHILDLDDNVYITGNTYSTDFPNTTGANDTTNNGLYDVFVMKLSLKSIPSVIDLQISKPTILRTDELFLYSNGSDMEDTEQTLTPIFEYRDPNDQMWNISYLSNLIYQNSRWEISFIPPPNSILGLYDFRVKFNDTDSMFSLWFYLNNSLTLLNNIPKVKNLYISNDSALLGDSVYIYVNGTDREEFENLLTPKLEYRDPSEQSWDSTYLNNPIYVGNRWVFNLDIPQDSLFGYYDFRGRFNDSDGDFSSWYYANDSLLVYNTDPKIIDAQLSHSQIYRTRSAFLFVNGTDFETPESMLTCLVQYKPDSLTDWADLIVEYSNSNWYTEFSTTINSIIGPYDFRLKFEDNETLSTGWLYINDSLEVLNNIPVFENINPSLTSVYRTNSIIINSNCSDQENSENQLTCDIQYKPPSDNWIDLEGEIYEIDHWKVIFTPGKEYEIGNYYIRVNYTDLDGSYTGWRMIENTVEVHNNPPKISDELDDLYVDYIPLVLDLSSFESDIEDTDTDLLWSFEPTTYTNIEYIEMLDTIADIIEITPKEDVTGSEEIELILTDKDGGSAVKSDITITINSTVPQPHLNYDVNITTENDFIIIKQGESKDINLTVTNKGNSIDNFTIETSSVNLHSHIAVDKNNVKIDPDVSSKIKLSIDIPDDFTIGDYSIGVTATSLTDSTAKDEVTINVKIVSKDVIPDYNASISISTTTLDLKQGDSANITLTITNNGNIEDDFEISFELEDIKSADISFSKSNLTLGERDTELIIVTIKIPKDMAPGVYTIKFIVKSNDDPKESSLTLTVKEKDGEESKNDSEDRTILFVLVCIIVIIFVVLILIFIFFKKKKGKGGVQSPPQEESSTEKLPQELSLTPEDRSE